MQYNRLILLFFVLVYRAGLGLTFHQSEATLQKIQEIILKKEKGAYLRFGDGDVQLVQGRPDLLQRPDFFLEYELREAFALNGPTLLKCLPLGCNFFGGLEPGMKPDNHEWSEETCRRLVEKVAPFWNGPMEDVYSMTALSYSATQYPDRCVAFLQFLKRSNCTIFVGNNRVSKSLVKFLFGENCHFITAPSNNAYDWIDSIEERCLLKAKETDEYQVVVIAMGCSGRALEKRLWDQLDRVFLFDFGSLLDAICGLTTRSWMVVTEFNGRKFLNALDSE